MKQIINHSKSAGLLNIIEGTDPLITRAIARGILKY